MSQEDIYKDLEATLLAPSTHQLSTSALLRADMVLKDEYQTVILNQSVEEVLREAEDVLKRVEECDLKSYDFSKDRDFNFKQLAW